MSLAFLFFISHILPVPQTLMVVKSVFHMWRRRRGAPTTEDADEQACAPWRGAGLDPRGGDAEAASAQVVDAPAAVWESELGPAPGQARAAAAEGRKEEEEGWPRSRLWEEPLEVGWRPLGFASAGEGAVSRRLVRRRVRIWIRRLGRQVRRLPVPEPEGVGVAVTV